MRQNINASASNPGEANVLWLEAKQRRQLCRR